MTTRIVTAKIFGRVIARSTQTKFVEGNAYFPEKDIDTSLLRASVLTTVCPWKGIARYRHLHIDGRTTPNAAWTYPLPLPLAWKIRRHIAFEQRAGVQITVETSPTTPADNSETKEHAR